jgi:hypothetical protein
MAEQQFPAVSSALASDALCRRVLSRYPLDEPPTCEFTYVGLNDTYQVRAGSSTYYLRVSMHGWREASDIDTRRFRWNCSTRHPTRRANHTSTRPAG